MTFYLIIIAIGCKQDILNKAEITDTNPPGVVSNVTVVNLNGKATLTYSLPGNNDLLYVKAVYQTSSGHTAEVKASHYTNTLTVVGFGDTLAHTVQLYAVNSSEVASAPVTVTVNPLTPAINLARRSLSVEATFGGFNLTCNNPTQENLDIIPLVDTAGNGKWEQTIDIIYSNSPVITSEVRGLPAITRKYAFVVRDRWLNYSDTLFVTLTPLFEQMLPKSAWSYFPLPNDCTILSPGTTDAKNMWDGNFNGAWPDVFFTVETSITPQTITIDLGAAHKFSRLLMNPFYEPGYGYYVKGDPQSFEIWGSNNPNASGAYDATWTKLLTCDVVKPSGSPYGTETAADITLATNGWPFDFPVGQSAYRYVRIRNLQNWQGSYFMSICEFTLWGN